MLWLPCRWPRGKSGRRRTIQVKATRITTETASAFADRAAVPADRGHKPRLAGLLAFGVLLCVALWGPLYSLVGYAAGNSLHSHILLVPFVTGYLIYLQRGSLPKSYRCSPVCGALMLAIGLAVFGFASRIQPEISPGDFLSLVAVSFVTLLIAGGFFFLGRVWMWAVCFPIAFLYFIVPLPDAAVSWLETILKLASAEAAGLFFDLSGTPVFRDGVVFQLPNITLEVARECSGIRSSWVLFVTSVVASYLLLKTPLRRALLLAVVIPLAILRNGFRIVVIGLLCVHFGPQMIHSFIHQNGGPLFFALSLVPLFLLLWWLRKGEAMTPFKKEPL